MKQASSWLSRLFRREPAAQNYGPASDFWYTDLGGVSKAGTVINADTAMKVSAVYACVKVLAESVAMLPLFIYQRLPNGGKQRVPWHRIYDLLHDQPNEWQTSFEWREMMMGHLLLRGNAYNQIISGGNGAISQLIPLNPDRIRVEQIENGRLLYVEQKKDGTSRKLTQDDVFHIRGLSSDGLTGLSVIGLMRETAGLAMATESYATRFFGQNAHPRGALETEKALSDDARQRLKKGWQSAYSGLDQSHSTAVLEDGLKWHQIGINNEDSQFLETRKFQVNDIARWFRMPPHMIADLEKATYSNIEHQSLDYVTYTLMPWLKRWEAAIKRDLITAKSKFYAEFLVDGLLRGDVKSRNEAYQIAVQNGWLSRNEVREKENMNPEDGLDEFLVPMNMAKAGDAPPPTNGNQSQARIVYDAAARLARKEIGEIRKREVKFTEEPESMLAWADRFYSRLEGQIVDTLYMPQKTAVEYCKNRKSELVERGLAVLERWETENGARLAALILEVTQ